MFRGMLSSALAIIIVSHAAQVFAEDKAESPWQGEWMSTDGKKAAGISITGCTGDSACVAAFFGLGGYSVSCFREGPARPAEKGDGLTATPSPSSPREAAGCLIELFREGTGAKETLRAKRVDDGSSCNLGSCEPFAVNEVRMYRRISKDNFNRKIALSGKCFDLPSPAGRAWCTDDEVQDIIEQADKIPYAEVGWSWGFDEKILKICDEKAAAGSDVRHCLRQAFGEKLAETEKESAALNETYGAAGDKQEAKKLLDKIHGVYKRPFKNSNVSGEQYDSEDILEIVPVAEDAAYIKVRLDFFNGHTCGAAGIAEYKKAGGFVFQDQSKGNKCLLTIRAEGDKIRLEDPAGICRASMCGARGSFDGVNFISSKRRTIRYMPLIEKSEEYKEALAAFEARRKP